MSVLFHSKTIRFGLASPWAEYFLRQPVSDISSASTETQEVISLRECFFSVVLQRTPRVFLRAYPTAPVVVYRTTALRWGIETRVGSDSLSKHSQQTQHLHRTSFHCFPSPHRILMNLKYDPILISTRSLGNAGKLVRVILSLWKCNDPFCYSSVIDSLFIFILNNCRKLVVT